MRSNETRSAGSRWPAEDDRLAESGHRQSIVLALWLAVLLIGYAVTVLPDLTSPPHPPLFPVDLLLPAYIGAIVAVAMGLLRPIGPAAVRAEDGATGRERSRHGEGSTHGG